MPTPGVPDLRTIRIVWFALLAGPLLFAIIIPLVDLEVEGEGLEFLPIAATALSVVSLPAAFLLRRQGFRRAGELEGDARMAAYAGATILFAAMLEGAMLFDLVTWMVTGQAIPVVPLFVLLLGIGLLNIPSRDQLDSLGRRD